mmetsp:Transcript_36489/g.77608  ORF Transcript_36489/g.77608 Transcript_36489/m.77608 type:complete len:376 (-) Transcript_36489:322-1449(-)
MPVSAEGRVYCGRRVGTDYHDAPHRWCTSKGRTRCSCDGRCGPSNGCQCRQCYEQTFTGTSSPNVRRQGEGGRMYCGRWVGADYHDGPRRYCTSAGRGGCNCDGRCGPNNGCQCKDCYEATFGRASPTPAASTTVRVVREGAEARKYCGRRVGTDYHQGPQRWCTSKGYARCGCDGRCGPTNGCQCKECYEQTFSTVRVARRGAQGRLYCGRRVDYHDGAQRWCTTQGRRRCSCDGRCGPNNGCQCRECYEETFQRPSGPPEAPPARPSPVSTPVEHVVVCPPPAVLIQEPNPTTHSVPSDSIPKDFLCPITQDLMSDPVIASDGNSYERAVIESWFSRCRRSPMTNEELPDTRLIPNRTLKRMIDDLKANHPTS